MEGRGARRWWPIVRWPLRGHELGGIVFIGTFFRVHVRVWLEVRSAGTEPDTGLGFNGNGRSMSSTTTRERNWEEERIMRIVLSEYSAIPQSTSRLKSSSTAIESKKHKLHHPEEDPHDLTLQEPSRSWSNLPGAHAHPANSALYRRGREHSSEEIELC